MAIVNNKENERKRIGKATKKELSMQRRSKHTELVNEAVKLLKYGYNYYTFNNFAYDEAASELKGMYKNDPDKLKKELDELKQYCYHTIKVGRNCRPVLKEPQNVMGILPDVIGWSGLHSYVVECKTSKADFLNDKKKKGKLGDYFIYFTYPGVIELEDLEEAEGLIYYGEKKKHICVKQPTLRENNYKDVELAILLSICRGTNINAKTDNIKEEE
jgi:hypothetical protein